MHNTHNAKTRLEALKGELEKEIKELEEKAPEFGSDTDHFEEETSEAEEYSKNLGIAKALRGRLANVETALEKLAAGTYGKCETCGMALSGKMLETDPESRYCEMCKFKMKK